MDKLTFKSRMLRFLEEDVDGLSTESKIKYMQKWIRDYEQNIPAKYVSTTQPQEEQKIGALVRVTIFKMARNDFLSPEKIRLLQDERYCKSTFDLNYRFLKKVDKNISISAQRKINGYDRYWAEEVVINRERFFICNDWYERNRTRFVKWVREIEINS
jgi:hypothetical protein